MSNYLPVVISSIALVVSIAGFGLSAYIARGNARLVKAQKLSDLLTRIVDVKIQYEDFMSRARKYAPRLLETEIKPREYEKVIQQSYESIKDANLSATALEEIRHHIDGILLTIAAVNRRVDEVLKENADTNGN